MEAALAMPAMPAMRCGRIAVLLFAALLTACAGAPEPAPQPGQQEAPPVRGQQVRLEGANNFRDLGGYATRDGREVQRGLLYRSDSLAQLTAADLETLARLELRTVYDFRTPGEVEHAADRLPPGRAIRRVELPIGSPGFDVEAMRRRVFAGDLEGLQLPDSYASLVLTRGDVYRSWFEGLLDPSSVPAVFHCSAGKDRTGVGAALFLYALGVPKETAMQDFMASNYYLHDHIEGTVQKVRASSQANVDEDRLRALLGVRSSYLENAFAAIESNYGSLDAYLEQALGLDEAKRARLRAIYLK